jgi:branched-chain amino acid transport system substrate-binding protein
MKRIFALVLALALLIPAAALAQETVKIGVIAPETGGVSVYGLAVRDGVILYTDEFNAEGGINGKPVELIVYDDKGDAIEALNAYNRLVYDDQVVAIIGPVTSTPTFGVAEVSAENGVPAITASATHPDVTTYGDNFFRACFEDPFQGRTIARFAANELGVKTAAIIYNTGDAYSVGLLESFSEAAEEAGLEIVATEGYAAGDVDFKAQLTNIAGKAPEALFIPDYYNTAYMIASQARELGLSATFLGVDGTDGVLTIEGADTSVFEGMYFPNHYAADDPTDIVVNFRKNFEDAYGIAPNAFAALGYDSAKILYAALANVENAGTELGATAESYAATIEQMKATDLTGLTGRITFDENNNPIKEVSIIKIENAQYNFFMKY